MDNNAVILYEHNIIRCVTVVFIFFVQCTINLMDVILFENFIYFLVYEI